MAPALVGWALFGLGLIQWLVLRRTLRIPISWVAVTAIAGSLSIGAFAGAEMLLDRYDPTMVWDSGRLSPPVVEDANNEEASDVVAATAQGMSTRAPVLWTWGLAGSVLGAIFGSAQWFLLRRHVRRAVWWIPTHLAAGAGGAVIVGIMANPLFSQSGGAGIEWWKLVYSVLSGGAFVGVISGAALVMLIRRSRGINSPS